MFRNHIEGNGGPMTAWRREDGIFLATAEGSERRIGTGRDPALAIAGTNTDVAWTGADGLVLMRGNDTQTIGPGRFPVLASFDRHTVIAWEHRGRVLIRRVPR